MPKNRKLLITIVLVFVLGTVMLSVIREVINQCTRLLETQPNIDVMPGAEVIRTTTTRTGEDYSFLAALLGAREYSRLLAEYTVDSAYEDVILFYQQYGECSDTEDGGIICYGQAQPIGNYYIGIDALSSAKTHFFIQLDWSLCGSEF